MTFLRLSLLSALLSPLAPSEDEQAVETNEQEPGAQATGEFSQYACVGETPS